MSLLCLDRHEAGQQLAQKLLHYKDAKDAIVIALPRGGVVVGGDISLALRLPLDVFISANWELPRIPNSQWVPWPKPAIGI